MKWNNSFSKWNKYPFIPEGIGASPVIILLVGLPPGMLLKIMTNPINLFINFLVKKQFGLFLKNYKQLYLEVNPEVVL